MIAHKIVLRIMTEQTFKVRYYLKTDDKIIAY